MPMPSQTAARPAAEVAEIARCGRPAGHGLRRASRTRWPAFGERDWPQPPRVLICGSLYLAGEVLAANGTPPT